MAGQQGAAAEPPAQEGLPGTVGSVRLSRTQAERVIRRALEIEDDQGGDAPLDLADVTDIARQLGVGADVVLRALSDVQMAQAGDAPASGVERLVGRSRVSRAAVVAAEVAQVRAGAAAWMAHDEGMVHTGTRGDTDRWVRDKRLLVNLRRGLQVDRGTGRLRDLRGVVVRITPDPQGALVAIEADTRSVQESGAGIAVGGTVLSVLRGAGAAAVVPETATISSDVAQFAAGVGPALLATAATTVAVTRTWLHQVQQAVEQALDGITMTTMQPHIPTTAPVPDGWRRTMQRWLGGDG